MSEEVKKAMAIQARELAEILWAAGRCAANIANILDPPKEELPEPSRSSHYS